MTTQKRFKTLIIDKKNNYNIYFSGFRKHKFTFDMEPSILKLSENELNDTDVFFVVVYEPKDIIQIVKLAPISKSIIIGTVNKRLFSSFKSIQDYPIVDLTPCVQLRSNLHDALARFY
jgi:hypothetical protein